jgi:hypothetical protein
VALSPRFLASLLARCRRSITRERATKMTCGKLLDPTQFSARQGLQSTSSQHAHIDTCQIKNFDLPCLYERLSFEAGA